MAFANADPEFQKRRKEAWLKWYENPENREKCRANLEKPQTEERRRKAAETIRRSMWEGKIKPHRWTAEQRKKMAKAKRGKPLSKAACEKQRQRWQKPEYREKGLEALRTARRKYLEMSRKHNLTLKEYRQYRKMRRAGFPAWYALQALGRAVVYEADPDVGKQYRKVWRTRHVPVYEDDPDALKTGR